MIKRLLVEVTIGDVENLYPNYLFNYASKEHFFHDNIISGLEHITDESAFDSGYETVVANTMLDCMDTFVAVGDKVGFIKKDGYMGKDTALKVGRVTELFSKGSNETYEEWCKIEYTTDKNKKSTISRKLSEILNIYDLLDEV